MLPPPSSAAGEGASCLWPALVQKVLRRWMPCASASRLGRLSTGVLAGLEDAEADPAEE